jgi:hypothetical protein
VGRGLGVGVGIGIGGTGTDGNTGTNGANGNDGTNGTSTGSIGNSGTNGRNSLSRTDRRALVSFNSMTGDARKRMLIACKQVSAGGGFDAGLVSLCKLLRNASLAGL